MLQAERGHQAVGYAFPIGKSDNFMSFAGTLTLSNATFVAVQKELIGCLYAHGFRRFVLLSANGGNANGMQTAADEIHKELGCPLLFVDPLPYQFSYKNEVLKNAKIDHLPMRPGEDANSTVLADTEALRQLELDAAGFTQLDEGVDVTVRYFMNYMAQHDA